MPTVPPLVIVTNPRSGANRRDPALASRLLARAPGAVVDAPGSLAELDRCAERWVAAGLSRLAVHGGDGTLHQALTALLRAAPDRPLPELVLLRGGTMNIVADSVGVKRRAEDFLGHALGGGTAVATRRLLRIEVDDLPAVHGFLSGNGIVARFLEKYYERPDPTPIDAARLLLRGSLSALVGGRLIRELVRPYVGRVTVDGVRLPPDRWTAVAIGSVEQMGLGFRVFHRLAERDDRFQVVALGGSVTDLARELPGLYRGRGVHRPDDSVHLVQELRLEADEAIPLMVDGDFYRADRGWVRMTLGPTVRFVV